MRKQHADLVLALRRTNSGRLSDRLTVVARIFELRGKFRAVVARMHKLHDQSAAGKWIPNHSHIKVGNTPSLPALTLQYIHALVYTILEIDGSDTLSARPHFIASLAPPEQGVWQVLANYEHEPILNGVQLVAIGKGLIVAMAPTS